MHNINENMSVKSGLQSDLSIGAKKMQHWFPILSKT